jgi:hypothetical protein
VAQDVLQRFSVEAALRSGQDHCASVNIANGVFLHEPLGLVSRDTDLDQFAD